MTRILSLDGGGCRGMLVVTILSEIEKNTGKRIKDLFDVFIGTSIGALIISLIIYTDMSMEDIKDLFTEKNMKQMVSRGYTNYVPFFTPKYDGIGKRNLITKYLPDVNLCNTNKKVIITGYDVNNTKMLLFKSWNEKTGTFKIADIIDLATSAPGYYNPVTISNKYHTIKGADGAICLNNPTLCGFVDSLIMYEDPITVLSIGTGSKKFNIKDSKTYGFYQWITKNDLENAMIEVPESISHYQMTAICAKFGYKYLRLEPELDMFLFDNVTKEYSEYLSEKSMDVWNTSSAEILSLFN